MGNGSIQKCTDAAQWRNWQEALPCGSSAAVLQASTRIKTGEGVALVHLGDSTVKIGGRGRLPLFLREKRESNRLLLELAI
jgi:hypothetical protein